MNTIIIAGNVYFMYWSVFWSSVKFITVFILQRNTYVEDLIEEVVVAPEQVMEWIRKGESKYLVNVSW